MGDGESGSARLQLAVALCCKENNHMIERGGAFLLNVILLCEQ